MVFVQQEHGGSSDESTKLMEHMVLDVVLTVSAGGGQRAGCGLLCRILWGHAQRGMELGCGLQLSLWVWRRDILFLLLYCLLDD